MLMRVHYRIMLKLRNHKPRHLRTADLGRGHFRFGTMTPPQNRRWPVSVRHVCPPPHPKKKWASQSLLNFGICSCNSRMFSDLDALLALQQNQFKIKYPLFFFTFSHRTKRPVFFKLFKKVKIRYLWALHILFSYLRKNLFFELRS